VRILETIPQMGVGGAERVVLDLLTGLEERGHELALVAAPGPLDEQVALPSGRRVLLEERGRSPLALPGTVRRQGRAIRAFRPEVVHAHGVRVAATAAIALRATALRRRPPIVVTFHGVVPSEYRVSARILGLVDHVVTVSGELAESLERSGLPRPRLSVIPNGVAAGAELGHEERARLRRAITGGEGDLVVTAVGRLVPEKNHARLLDAARIVVDRRPGTRFLVVGDGALRPELERRAAELSLPEVRFLGMRADARAIIGASDVVVFSSDSEGMSIAALEAMAAGVPVVSTPATGMIEILDGQAGRVAHDFAPATLADCLLELAGDGSAREAMGAAGRALVAERHSVEAMVRGYDELFTRLAGR
jgi:glycosyltransferase involved in cell wall biosynthesis